MSSGHVIAQVASKEIISCRALKMHNSKAGDTYAEGARVLVIS